MGSPVGLWTSVSGGVAQTQAVDVIANNIANANTVGFKKDSPTFKEYLTIYERPPSPAIDIPRTIFKDSDFYHTDGREHAMVNLNKIHTDQSQGHFRMTNAPFDLAIDGPGFFAVKTPAGIRFTRAGDFKVDTSGKLVTSDGYAVMSLEGGAQAQGAAEPPATQGAPGTEPGRSPTSTNPFVQAPQQATQVPGQPPPQSLLKEVDLKDILESGKKIEITAAGLIVSGSEEVGSIALAEFTDPRLLKKETSTLYSNPNPANVPRVGVGSRLRQGFLEMSNVNAVGEIVELLKANRLFESNMKAIKTYNEMSSKEANEVGKL